MGKAKTGTTQAITKWDARLAELAKGAKKAESAVGGGGNFLSFKAGTMSYQGANIPDNKMQVIVLDAILENQYYTSKFDPESPNSPDCYAFGRDPDDMAPDAENVAEPQNETCAGCPHNEWGSADVGRGKACKEVRRLALITSGDLDNIAEAEIAYAKIPVTSVKGWAGYVRQLEEVYNKPPLAFITEMSIVPAPGMPGWKVNFKLVSQIDDPETFEYLMAKYDEVSKQIAFPYPKPQGEAEAPAPKGNGRAARTAKGGASQRSQVIAPPAPVAAAKVGLRRPVKAAKY
jgi:hypothetical protein